MRRRETGRFEGKGRRSLESARGGSVHQHQHSTSTTQKSATAEQRPKAKATAAASNHRKEQEPPEPLLPEPRFSQTGLVGHLCLRQLWKADLIHNRSIANNPVQLPLRSTPAFPATYIVLFVLPCRSSKMLSRAVRPALSVGNATLARYAYLLDFFRFNTTNHSRANSPQICCPEIRQLCHPP